jgi:hypothetical protein
MQTVALARGRLTGTRFWLSKKEFDITRIDDNGQAVRQKQMLTVLDADIDLGALLDGADEAQPALDAASRAVALLESDGTVQSIGDPVLQPEQQAEDARISDGASSGIDGADGHNDDAPDHDETLEDKRHRMSDLLHRLGLSQPERQNGFRKYAHQMYGRGWIERIADVDAMNARLKNALDDPSSLDVEIQDAIAQAAYV